MEMLSVSAPKFCRMSIQMPGKDIYVRKPGQATFPKDPSRYGKWMWIKGAPDIFSAENEADNAQLRRLLIPAISDIAIGELETLVQEMLIF